VKKGRKEERTKEREKSEQNRGSREKESPRKKLE
jgi:hypothetical protein